MAPVKGAVPPRSTLAGLCHHIYDPANRETPAGWSLVDTKENEFTSFFGGVYEPSAETAAQCVVVACRGADTLRELKRSGNQLAGGEIPEQFADAFLLCDEIVTQVSAFGDGRSVIIAGHSLGGALTQLLACNFGCLGVTFNAPGVRPIAQREFGYDTAARAKVVSYVVADDVVGNYGIHVGMASVLPRAGFFNGPLTPHRAWHLLKGGTPDTSLSPNFDRAVDWMSDSYPEVELARLAFDTGLVDFGSLAGVVLPEDAKFSI